MERCANANDIGEKIGSRKNVHCTRNTTANTCVRDSEVDREKNRLFRCWVEAKRKKHSEENILWGPNTEHRAPQWNNLCSSKFKRIKRYRRHPARLPGNNYSTRKPATITSIESTEDGGDGRKGIKNANSIFKTLTINSLKRIRRMSATNTKSSEWEVCGWEIRCPRKWLETFWSWSKERENRWNRNWWRWERKKRCTPFVARYTRRMGREQTGPRAQNKYEQKRKFEGKKK